MSDVTEGIDVANHTLAWMRRSDERVDHMTRAVDDQSKRIDDTDRKLDMVLAGLA
jgi:hypothetical protein